MATFDEAQVTDLAEILGTNSDVLDQHLDLYAAIITDADKTAILSRVRDFQAIEDDNIYVTAAAGGFQGRISPTEQRSLIKNRIAALIQWPISSGSGLVRG